MGRRMPDHRGLDHRKPRPDPGGLSGRSESVHPAVHLSVSPAVRGPSGSNPGAPRSGAQCMTLCAARPTGSGSGAGDWPPGLHQPRRTAPGPRPDSTRRSVPFAGSLARVAGLVACPGMTPPRRRGRKGPGSEDRLFSGGAGMGRTAAGARAPRTDFSIGIRRGAGAAADPEAGRGECWPGQGVIFSLKSLDPGLIFRGGGGGG